MKKTVITAIAFAAISFSYCTKYDPALQKMAINFTNGSGVSDAYLIAVHASRPVPGGSKANLSQADGDNKN